MEEIWKDIPEYEGLYQVSDLGRVKNIKNGYILKPFDRDNRKLGYLTVHLVSKHIGKRFINKNIHALVMLAFKGLRPDNNVIHHKDHNPSNNNLSNLKYCTQSYNRKQDFIDGTQSFLGSKNNLAKINEEQVLEILDLRKIKKLKLSEIGALYGISISGVSSIVNGYTWSHITGIKNKTNTL